MRPSRRAVWAAVNSDQGARLVEIALEHASLAKQLIITDNWGNPTRAEDVSYDIIRERIAQLRVERDAIIEQFEEEN